MPPKTEDQYEAIRQSSVAKIKEAALELFASNGYHSTSISQIAKEAGISKGLMYNYFNGKKALLHDIILEAVEVNEHLMKEVMDSNDTPLNQLKRMLFGMAEMIKQNPHHWKLLSALAFQQDAMKELVDTVQEKQKEFMEIGFRLFSELGVDNPEMEMMYFGALIDGIFFHYLSFTEGYPIDDMIEYILKKYEPK
jgi:AcrR family transcriptional regulator